MKNSKEMQAILIAIYCMREGDTLHHCVGRMGYDLKFVREETLIFLVRNAEEPDTPFVSICAKLP